MKTNSLSTTRDSIWGEGFLSEKQREMGRLDGSIARHPLYENNVWLAFKEVKGNIIYLVKPNQPLKKVV